MQISPSRRPQNVYLSHSNHPLINKGFIFGILLHLILGLPQGFLSNHSYQSVVLSVGLSIFEHLRDHTSFWYKVQIILSYNVELNTKYLRKIKSRASWITISPRPAKRVDVLKFCTRAWTCALKALSKEKENNVLEHSLSL